MVGDDHSLKMEEKKSVWKILNKRMLDLMNELMNFKAVCRAYPASLGLVKSSLVSTGAKVNLFTFYNEGYPHTYTI